MASAKAIFHELQAELKLEDRQEAYSVALALMVKHYGMSLTDILKEKEVERADLSPLIERLNQHEPLQYVLEEAYFYERKFAVNPSVLIPRPETELLIREVLNIKAKSPRILDVGTGSGCIAITLALEIANATVYGIDVSEHALSTAAANARLLDAQVVFLFNDFLRENVPVGPVDLIVSNPPYVLECEKLLMQPNVLNYEPHHALFVPDNSPLLFYNAIASKSRSLLTADGKIVVEINEKFGRDVAALFESVGFNRVEITKDIDGKDRIVVAQQLR